MKKYTKTKRFAKKFPILFLSLILLASLALGVIYVYDTYYGGNLLFLPQKTTSAFPGGSSVPDGDTIEVHFIDVGQGDGVLIKTPDGNVIIDSGPKKQSDSFIDYLKDQGVSSIKYAIFTHPHEDHMGSAQFVLDEFEIENVVMNDRVSTSQFFKRALDVIEEKNINTLCAKAGDVYTVGDLKMTVLSPRLDEYKNDDINNSSIILYVQYGSSSFIFTGDAEKEAEREVVNAYGANTITCDVLKIGHHGSSSSSTDAFLACVSPKYAVISVGEGNEYGHPSQEVLLRLKSRNITYYTTEDEGSIVFVSDGKNLTKR